MRIGIVAGEASGDLLGAGLIEAIRRRHPQAQFEGIAGPRMRAAGCTPLFDAEKLSVMGLVEVLGHLPELLKIRKQVRQHFLAQPPDVFVGVDAPDFNLRLERQLRDAGIPTVHYVSPSVWAWRQGRVRHIGRSADRVLTLFPFEARFYERFGIDARFVGHPLADRIPLETDRTAARRELGLPESGTVVALLPGSREGEVRRLAAPFLRAAARCAQARPRLRFVVPMAGASLRAQFEMARMQEAPELAITVTDGHAHRAMTAADVVLLASGTAALEALLLSRPMVVAYKLAPLSYALVKGLRMLKAPYYSLPNWLCGEAVVPELIQGDAHPEALSRALLQWLDEPQRMQALGERFAAIHRQLRRGASEAAAEAVLDLIGDGKKAEQENQAQR